MQQAVCHRVQALLRAGKVAPQSASLGPGCKQAGRSEAPLPPASHPHVMLALHPCLPWLTLFQLPGASPVLPIQLPLVKIPFLFQDPVHVAVDILSHLLCVQNTSVLIMPRIITLCLSVCVISHQLDYKVLRKTTCLVHIYFPPTGQPDSLIVSQDLISTC